MKDGDGLAGGFQTLIFEKTGPVAEITLNRPQALNVYNIQMRDELSQVLLAIRDAFRATTPMPVAGSPA